MARPHRHTATSPGIAIPGLKALLVLCFFLLASAARGESIKGEIVSVGIGGVNGAHGIYRTGSWVPVEVRLQNMTGQTMECRLGVQSNELNDLDGDKVTSLGPVFTLTAGPDARTLWTYYWPGPDESTNTGVRGISTVIVFDKTGTRILGEVATPDGQPNAVGLTRADDGPDGTGRSARFVVVLGKSLAGWNSFQRTWGGTESVALAQVTNPNQLPDDVKGLDPVDVIVWEADTVKPSEIPGEFQMKAILQWVRAGGHLIISTGSQWQELLKADPQLQAAMPMTIRQSRTVPWSDVKLLTTNLARDLRSDALKDKSFDQVVGDLKPAARAVMTPDGEAFAKAPLVVTGLYGQGAVTLVTFDVTNKDLQNAFKEITWAQFWTASGGWIWQPNFLTGADYDKMRDLERQNLPVANFVNTSPLSYELGTTISSDVDVKEFTFVRIFAAIVFLAIYWLLAGPIGHLILRTYKVVHWSWWVFGGTVVLAMVVAGVVVTMLHVSAAQVRHKTYVLGRVNSRDVSVASYYGVYAAASGAVQLTQPPGDGMNYLVPMCFTSATHVKAYADPQSYTIWDDHASNVSPIFRNTLKKMQGRWSGELPGVTGEAQLGADPLHLLKGRLTNESGYDLTETDILVYKPIVNPRTLNYLPGSIYLYRVGGWKNGESLDLEKDAGLDVLNAKPNATDADLSWRFAELLEDIPHADNRGMGSYSREGNNWSQEQNALFSGLRSSNYWQAINRRYSEDILMALTDARALDPLDIRDRTEVVRGMGRLVDSTKALHAAGALIIAHTDHDAPVKAPVPLELNGTELPSKGDVEFVWTLPVTGDVPAEMKPAAPAN